MPELILTGDGSHTFYIPEKQEHYHSVHGAIAESMHVFINAGLNYCAENKELINILEVGLGTGLNCLLTLKECQELKKKINYHALEPYPLNKADVLSLNYCEKLQKPELAALFELIHETEFEKVLKLSELFSLTKHRSELQNFIPENTFDVIYFDAFAPRVQPELWTISVFKSVYEMLNLNGILVTYCAKGEVKRNLKAAGFMVETLAGPPGKREMVRAVKL